MKAALNKQKYQLVTFCEYADYWGIPIEELDTVLNNGKK